MTRTETSDDERIYRDVEDNVSSLHPLELIPFFRRWPCSLGRDLIYTVIFSTSLSVIFILLSLMSSSYSSADQFWRAAANNWVISNVVGFSFHFFFATLGPYFRRINRLPLWANVLSYTLISTAIVQVGFLVVSLIPGYEGVRAWTGTVQSLGSSLIISFVISLIMGLAWNSRITGLLHEAEVARERERLQAAERAAVQANLRASLASTRAQNSTLGREAELMRAFLRLIKIRMGERL